MSTSIDNFHIANEDNVGIKGTEGGHEICWSIYVCKPSDVLLVTMFAS